MFHLCQDLIDVRYLLKAVLVYCFFNFSIYAIMSKSLMELNDVIGMHKLKRIVRKRKNWNFFSEIFRLSIFNVRFSM